MRLLCHHVTSRPGRPDDSFGPVVIQTPAGSNVCHRGCAYTVLQTVQRPGLRSVVDGTMNYRGP